MTDFSFCETVHAMLTPRWHIRRLAEGEQRKFGGGLKTKTLCDLPLNNGWDIKVDFKRFDSRMEAVTCTSCYEQWKEED